MKICIINNLYKPYSRGGAERVIELNKKGLIALGHKVSIITTRPIFSKPNIKNKKQIWYLPSTYYFWNKLPKVIRPVFHIFNIFNIFQSNKILKILKTNKINLVISNNLLGLNMLFLLKLKKLSIKHIHILHDIQLLHPSGLMMKNKEQIIDSTTAKIYQKITKLFFSSAYKVFSPSLWLLNLHKNKHFFSKMQTQVLLNPIQSNFLEIKNRKIEKDFTLLFVGLLSEAKGIFTLLKAFNSISNNKFRLKLIGQNLIKEKLYFYLAKNNNIEYKGKLNHKEVLDNMKKADALIMPSLCYENSPTVIYEAIKIGLGVVASDIGGTRELKQNDNISLFKTGDSADLSRKIIKMQQNYSKNRHKKNNNFLPAPREYAKKLLN
ncbi:MAG: glycosyltransferase [Patescibacteria group bacterium]|nr:glycosyltransferase [Patescibacteria group bacterium]